jgi:hypothetical protein
LTAADRVQIFALDPKTGPENAWAETEKDGRFHGYRILGVADVAEGPERVGLLDALQDGMNRAPECGAACFFPRHGLRVVMGKSCTDYLICFECSWVHVYGGTDTGGPISAAPRERFSATLTAHGVPLPPEL